MGVVLIKWAWPKHFHASLARTTYAITTPHSRNPRSAPVYVGTAIGQGRANSLML